MSPTPKMPPLAKLVVGVTFLMLIAGGVGLIVKGGKAIGESRESRTWPTAPGKIVRSEMVIATTTKTGRGSERNRSTTSTSHQAKIEYEYTVNGETRLGTRVTIAESITNRAIAQATIDKYPLNRAVTVSYKADDPSVCLLEPGSWGGIVVYFALATLFLSIPVVLLIVARKLTRPPATAPSDTLADQGAWME